jgi:hypothetical protein
LDAEDTCRDVFETKEEFERQLDRSPPSIYLFRDGDRQHPSAAVRLDPLPKAIFPGCR